MVPKSEENIWTLPCGSVRADQIQPSSQQIVVDSSGDGAEISDDEVCSWPGGVNNHQVESELSKENWVDPSTVTEPVEVNNITSFLGRWQVGKSSVLITRPVFIGSLIPLTIFFAIC